MATGQTEPTNIGSMLAGAGLASGNPYAMAGGVGMKLLGHWLGRKERRRQQRLQQVAARWAPYTGSPLEGLKGAMAHRAQGEDLLLAPMAKGAASFYQQYEEPRARSVEERMQGGTAQPPPTVEERVGQMAPLPLPGAGSAYQASPWAGRRWA